MIKKVYYEIIINSKPKHSYDYVFGYRNTKNIKLKIGRNSALIAFEMSVCYEPNEIFDKSIVIDAIKKAYLCHILLYGSNIQRNTIKLLINDTEYYIEENRNNRLFSLIQDNDTVDYKNKIKDLNKIINNIINIPINKSEDPRIACLYSFIMSERQKYSVEKFIYTWMSFNAFYNALYILDNGKSINNDSEKLKNINSHYYGINENVQPKEGWKNVKERISYLMYAIVDNWKEEPVTYKLVNKDFREIINNVLNTNNRRVSSEYCYLLTEFSYFFRCKIIHGSKPLKLLCFEKERELKCIKFVNSLLNEFLKEHLCDIYSEE